MWNSSVSILYEVSDHYGIGKEVPYPLYISLVEECDEKKINHEL